MKTARGNMNPAAARNGDYRVRVRMYRQGLGDCFLLSFRKKDHTLMHLMIDCGVVLGTKDPAVPMKKVANNLQDITEGKIDVLVVTHEHWDHLSGFSPGQAQKELGAIEFGELWLAWTEDEKNDLANALRRERELKKAAAAAMKERLKKLEGKADKRVERLTALLEFNGPTEDGGGEGDGGTAGALRFLKNKISRRRILHPGQPPLTIPGLEGVRIYVMGPPEDKTKLHKTNPGKGQGYALGTGVSLAEVFAAALDVNQRPGSEIPELAQPFAPPFRKGMDELGADSSYKKTENAWRNIDEDWLGVGERLALQLDSDTNNTSLVLAFEFIDTEEVLLFVGDAQAGNWLSWDEYKWNVKDKNGDKQEITAEQLLNRTILYKVGHHGSHNATLREKGLERMTHPDLVAMMPVDEQVAHETKGWLHMPLPNLCDRLNEKCAAFVRSDVNKVAGGTPKRVRLESDPLFFDYFI